VVSQRSQSPHDAWLQEVTIFEQESTESQARSTSVRIQLLGAYHDKVLEFTYANVSSYTLEGNRAGRGLVIGDMMSSDCLTLELSCMRSSGGELPK
jgi:hypothetical protein